MKQKHESIINKCNNLKNPLIFCSVLFICWFKTKNIGHETNAALRNIQLEPIWHYKQLTSTIDGY